MKKDRRYVYQKLKKRLDDGKENKDKKGKNNTEEKQDGD